MISKKKTFGSFFTNFYFSNRNKQVIFSTPGESIAWMGYLLNFSWMWANIFYKLKNTKDAIFWTFIGIVRILQKLT